MLLTGALNANTALKWVVEGQQSIDAAPDTCMLDLANVDSIDSAGIAILLALERHANHLNKKLVLKNPPAKLLSMLELYELKSVFHL